MRFPFEAEIAKLPSEVQRAHRFAFNGILDLNQAIAALKQQVDEKTSQTTTITSTGGTSSSSETIITTPSTIGFVNNQTAITSYATQQSDYGAFILLSDASPIAISLTDASVITLPWFTTLINGGTGTATLTPLTGLINGNASFSLPTNQWVMVGFDGTNFWTVDLPIATTLTLGVVQPDGSTIAVSPAGIISIGLDFSQTFMLMGA